MRRGLLVGLALMSVLLASTAVPAAGAGSARAASPTPAESLGPAPLRCATGVHDCLGGLSYDYAHSHDEALDSLTVSYLGGLVVSPHLVHVGQDVTATIVGALTTPCFGSAHCVSGYSWSTFTALGQRVSGCVGGSYQATSCTIKVTSASAPPSPGGEAWDKAVVTICGTPGCANDEDFIYVLGSKRGVSGYVTDSAGKPVRNADVTIGNQYTKTDSAGFYSAIVKPGRYVVDARGPSGPGKPTSCSPGSVKGANCTLDLSSRDGVADFQLQLLKHSISFSFAPARVTADGTGHFDGVVADQDQLGDPVSGQSLTVAPPLDVSPPALVCSSRGLVYPTPLSDGTSLGSRFQDTTDGSGHVPLAVWPGTVPGSWLLDAAETNAPSVTGSIALPFGTPPSAPFPPNDQLAQELYSATRGGIGGTAGPNLFLNFNAVGQSAASDQAVLLAFLQSTGRAFFPGSDFGPVHEGNHAGILFYPQGSSTPTTGRTAVIDVAQAAAIISAAGTGAPIPAADLAVPTLGAWAPVPGQAPAVGSLNPVPDQQLTYFGFPYPPAITNAAAVGSFYGPCLAPDPALATLQVHSPVSLVFTDAHGRRFGLGPSGQRIHTGIGLALKTGEETTYAVPAGSYRIAIRGTGHGQAHLLAFTAGRHAERIATFTFAVRRGQSGVLHLTAAGPANTLLINGRHVRATPGLPLSVRGLPTGLKRRRHRTLHLLVSVFGQPIAGALIRVRGQGVNASARTNRSGRAALTVAPSRRGTVGYSVTAPAAATLRGTVRVR